MKLLLNIRVSKNILFKFRLKFIEDFPSPLEQRTILINERRGFSESEDSSPETQNSKPPKKKLNRFKQRRENPSTEQQREIATENQGK